MSSARTERRWAAWTRSLAFRIGALQLALFGALFAILLAASDHATRTALVTTPRGFVQHELAGKSEGDLDTRCAPTRAVFAGGEDGAMRSSPLSESTRMAAMRLAPSCTAELALSASSWREATLHRLRESYAWILACMALLSILGAAFLTRRALRPIRELAATAQRVVREGDFAARVPRRNTGDELDRLASCFNEMLAHNERLVRGMRDALDHVAHDLRTPLTRLRATAELSLHGGDPAAQCEALADVVEESDRVLATLRTLTDITEAESGAMRLDRRPFDLNAVAREVIDLYAHVADEAGVALRAELGEPVAPSADRVRIAQALANLVDNAIKYTREGGEVIVEVRREGETAILRVRDTGAGIPEHALARIWERLYRADASRSQRGLGLGLSFVKAIVEAHGGEARVTSALGRGSVFELRIPMA